MADEVSTTMVLRMRDEASTQMSAFAGTTGQASVAAGALGESSQSASSQLVNLTSTTEQATLAGLNFQMTLTAVGSALTAVGALVNQLESPTAKMAATWLMTGGAIMTTTSAIIMMIPYIRNLITWLRALAVTQAIVKALSGPVGWAQLGIGLAIAGAATAGIVAMTGGFGGRTTTVNIQGGPLIMENDAQMRRFASTITEAQRREEKVGR